jgi:hypothetical protein
VTRRLLAGAGILAGTLALAACNQPSAAPSSATTPAAATTTPSSKGAPAKPAADGKDLPVRVLFLDEGKNKIEIMPPRSGFTTNGTGSAATTDKQTTDKPDTDTSETDKPGTGQGTDEKPDKPTPAADEPTTGKNVDLKNGEPTDYIPVKVGSVVSVEGQALTEIPNSPGDHATIVIAKNADGKFEATGFVEKDGKHIGVFGTAKQTESRPPEGSKAFVIASGIGLGKIAKTVKLGTPGKGCLVDQAVSDKEFGSQNVTPGDLELSWFTDDSCKKATGTTQKVTLEAGKQAYAFAWSLGGEPQVVFVPVNGNSKAPAAADETTKKTEPAEDTDTTTTTTEPDAN